MFALKKKSATLALATGLALTLAACAEDADTETTVTQDVDAEPVAELDDLTGVSTEVDVDPSFLTSLESLEVTPGVVGDATLEAGTLSFPITSGEVTYYDPDSGRDPFVEGEIEHEGSGLSLTANGTTVELTDFVVNPGTSILTGTVSADGDVVQEDAELLFLDGRTLEPLQVDDEEGTAVLEGTTVSLTQDAADLLNDTFGTDALTEFLLVGTATITLALEDTEATPSPSPTTTTETETETETQTESQTESETETETGTETETETGTETETETTEPVTPEPTVTG